MGEIVFAIAYGLYCHLNLFEIAAFEKEAANSEIYEPRVVFFLAIHGENDDLDIRETRESLLGGLDAIHYGHGDVHEDDVWPCGHQMVDELLPVACLERHVSVAEAAQQSFEASTEKMVVVNEPDVHYSL